MPLLAAEPALFPSDLFDASPAPDASLRWAALYVKARAEKAVARKLLSRGVSFFLPLGMQQWRSQGRLRSSFLPLFPGYVFLLANEEARQYVLETNLISRILAVDDQSKLHADLARIHLLIETGQPLTPVDRLKPGTLVEVIGGALEGTRGKIIREGKHLQFVVEVKFLQRGVSLEIDARLIRPVSEPAALAS